MNLLFACPWGNQAESVMSNQVVFQERLARIRQGSQIRPEGVITGPLARPNRAVRGVRLRLGAFWTFSALFFLGVTSVFMARYGRFQVWGIERAEFAALDGVILDLGAAGLSLIVLLAMTKLNTMVAIVAHLAGTFMSFFGMHLAVHRFPDFFGDVFSLRWLFMVLQSTDPNKLMLTLGG